MKNSFLVMLALITVGLYGCNVDDTDSTETSTRDYSDYIGTWVEELCREEASTGGVTTMWAQNAWKISESDTDNTADVEASSTNYDDSNCVTESATQNTTPDIYNFVFGETFTSEEGYKDVIETDFIEDPGTADAETYYYIMRITTDGKACIGIGGGTNDGSSTDKRPQNFDNQLCMTKES